MTEQNTEICSVYKNNSWACIVFLLVFFISELNFLFLMLVSLISPQGLE
uniref:Uncharacterized protein n=1 Tax=Rhinolophus ferrumequinum TaxID=59479 RepID=A0A671DQD6_RHIFE